MANDGIVSLWDLVPDDIKHLNMTKINTHTHTMQTCVQRKKEVQTMSTFQVMS